MRTLATGVIISFVRSLRALLSSFLSLSLSLSSSHPPLTLSGLSGAHLCEKTPAPTGEIGREGGGMRSRRRGEEARVQSIEKLSECERAPGRRVDKIRRGSHLPAELERGCMPWNEGRQIEEAGVGQEQTLYSPSEGAPTLLWALSGIMTPRLVDSSILHAPPCTGIFRSFTARARCTNGDCD
ncbi:hypothetical protein DPX16_18559 [Anabarilius grahami]|uniref:Secreted protein n=1 Tax=Anabarilius grahami TaxID=495550 RepID=A0A3N0YAA6_ANAGA|nr:hypothetical protein DPX16_18559 [Anabarilius grahami]